MDLNSLFENDPHGWVVPREKTDPLTALARVGLSDAHIKFVRAVAKAGRVTEPQAVREMRLLSAERLAAALSLSNGYPWLPWTKVALVRIDGGSLRHALVAGGEGKPVLSIPIHQDEQGNIWYGISDPAHAREARLVHGSKARFVTMTPKTLSTLYYRHYDSPREHLLKAIQEERWRTAAGWLLTESVYLGQGGVENIYFEPGPVSGQVFVQVEGVRQHLHSFELTRSVSGTLEGVYGRLINLIAADIRAQEGAISVPGALSALIPEQLDGRYDFRVELKQTFWGRAAVLRPFDLQADVADIDLLGFDSVTRERLRAAIESPYGLVVVVGPTSSGKNTSAISMLYATDPLSRSIQTVEQPVEVRVAAWEQHQLPPNATDADEVEKASRTITDSLLRSAPQVIYWGEVRNADAMNRALSAANTGHLTLTTYHAGDVASAILRMRSERTRAGDRIDMSSAGELLIGMLAQRLLRKLCPVCAVPEDRQYVRSLLERSGLDPSKAKRSGEGCDRCSDTGYTGRVLAYEWFEPKRDMDLSTMKAGEIRESMAANLFQCGLRRIAEGATDHEETVRVLRTQGAPAVVDEDKNETDTPNTSVIRPKVGNNNA